MANMYPSKKAGGGGSGTRTTLWTNSTPTSSLAFKTINLSQSINNFTYIVFRYAVDTTNQTDAYCSEIIISTENLKKCLFDDESPHPYVELGGMSGNLYARHVSYNYNATKLVVEDCYRVNASGTSNTKMILLSVEGLNF